jgi:hypothetical protein
LSGVVLITHEHLYRLVRKLTSGYTTLWFNASGNPPLFVQRFSRQEQREREKQIDVLRRHTPPSGRKRIIGFIAQEIPGRPGAHLRRYLDECGRTGDKFVRRARRFDPKISEADIEQALRNLWVFNSIQFYLGKPVSMTPSSFAYSLLYPYTDNCLDGEGETSRGKQELVRWLSSELSGHSEPAGDPRKEAIAALLALIRKEHPRSRRPDVHQSLFAIHSAQKKATHLCGVGAGRTEHALVPLTVEKGGTSVLVDGFLAGRLSTLQAEAVFGYGVLLQLVDDLQDLQEDVDCGHSSPFSRAIRHGTLEGITNRLFNLTGVIARQLKSPDSPQNVQIAALVERSCTLLIQHAIARHARHYRKGYLTQLNEFTPVRLAYLRELKGR